MISLAPRLVPPRCRRGARRATAPPWRASVRRTFGRARPAARLLLGALGAMLLLGLPAPAAGQDIQDALREAERILGRPVSTQEILRLLQQSGLTPDQVRDRLEGRGYARDAADPFLAVMEGRAVAVPESASPIPLFEALTGVELAAGLAIRDTLAVGELGQLPLPVEPPVEEEPGPPVFGREIFRRATTQFQALTTGPAPPDYRVGPGDELVLVLTGDVEAAYRAAVSREGWVVIPDVGRLEVSGYTLSELEGRLTRRLSEVYSGLTGDVEATTFLDLSLGSLRTKLVFVIGEVERPGAYQIAGFAGVFPALYSAGGPSRTGSFRRILVNRGTRTHAEVDLYDYLLDGRGERTARLEEGDVVFVPLAERQVEITGAVKRPGIYELGEGDGLLDVLRFAGGLAPSASAGRVQVERVLPPSDQREGLNRILMDLPLGDLAAREAGPALVDGDRITVFTVLEDVRNDVRIAGGVWRPGSYGVEPGTRLWDVIERAGGLLPDVYEGRAQIQRLNDDYTRRMIQVSLARDAAGRLLENPRIEELDQIYVFARRDLREERVVSIGGWVRQPGLYPYVEGMTVRDLILRAAGMRTGAYLGAVDIARVSIEQGRSDTLTRTFTVALDSSLVFDAPQGAGPAGSGAGAGGGASGAGSLVLGTPAGDFGLENLDAVYVRKAPGFEPQRSVIVTGEVLFPGPYSIETRSERLADLLDRAGGLTDEAYPEGIQLWRSRPEAAERPEELTAAEIAAQALGDTAVVAVPVQGQEAVPAPSAPRGPEAAPPAEGAPAAAAATRPAPSGEEAPPPITRTRVGVDYLEALRDPLSPHNILIEPNDSVHVPTFIPTVSVEGAVEAPAHVLYRQGVGGDYYIDRAGGYAQNADKGRTRIQRANGEVQTRGARFLFFGGGLPEPDPGSVITVPYKLPKERGLSITEVVAMVSAVATAAATVIIATGR